MNKAECKTNQLIIVSIATLFLIALLAGCLGNDSLDSSKAPEYVDEPIVGLEIQHEQGTAKYGPDEIAKDYVWQSCYTPGTTIGGLCNEHVVPLINDVPSVSEADPALDILGATFAETSTDFLISVELSELHEGWGHVEEGVSIYYDVFWETGMARFHVENRQGGIQYDAHHWEFSGDCNDWWICGTKVSTEIEYGQPGLIHYVVPRSIMTNATIDEGFEVYQIAIWQQTQPEAVVLWSLNEDPLEEDGWSRPGQNFFRIDHWSGEETFTFQTPLALLDQMGPPVTNYSTHMENTFDRLGQYRPDIDIQEIVIDETDTTFAVSVRLGAVSETPEGHELWIDLGMPSGRVHTAGYDVVDDEREAYAGYEDPTSDWRWIDVPIQMEVEPGEPGWVTFTWNRTDLGSPRIGERLTLLWVFTQEQLIVDEKISAGPATLEFRETKRAYDWSGDVPPYWFQKDTPPRTEEALGITIEDEVGDTTLPPTLFLDDVNEDQYDITYIEAKGRDESTTYVALGIEDLSQINVPTGYEAVIYSVGLQTDAGKFQALYYKDNEQQGYYCATDTLIFTDDPTDPNEVVMTPISGLQSHGGRSQEGGMMPASGAMVFHVPHECLGVKEGNPFEVHNMAAGTFLLEDPLGLGELATVHTIDTTHAVPGDLPALLGVQAIEPGLDAPSAWYVAPLGLEGQDWNILGVVIAVLLAAGGAIAVWAKRRKLRRYLARVDQAAAIKDLAARETALAELRTLLRADLVAGQVSEGHYTVVMRHIDEAMKHVRVKSIEETFRELPFHIVSKLRSVLDDGVITQDEHEMVTDLIDRAQIPAEDKQKVLSRLQRWQLVDEVVKP